VKRGLNEKLNPCFLADAADARLRSTRPAHGLYKQPHCSVFSIFFSKLPCGVMSALPPPGGASAQLHYERPITKRGPYQGRVVVFVHGIFGDADSTWRYSPSVYWPRLLLADETFRGSDVYVVNYSSPYFGNTMNVDEVVTNLNNRLVSDQVFSMHREVVFVCHSLGGLIAQRLLLTFRQYAAQVPFIYFFSTPETGAQVANLASVFNSDPLLRALIPGDENTSQLYLRHSESRNLMPPTSAQADAARIRGIGGRWRNWSAFQVL
jgi:pimeloyl-ACP methyl ester carboxylesterase